VRLRSDRSGLSVLRCSGEAWRWRQRIGMPRKRPRETDASSTSSSAATPATPTAAVDLLDRFAYRPTGSPAKRPRASDNGGGGGGGEEQKQSVETAAHKADAAKSRLMAAAASRPANDKADHARPSAGAVANASGGAAVQGLPPVVPSAADWAPHTLLLGSAPSVLSLAAGQYYANPHNHFWPIMAALLANSPHAFDLSTADYAARCTALNSAGYLLWDAIQSCRRTGSSDASITDVRVNDFAALMRRYPTIVTVACNGSASFDCFMKWVMRAERIPRERTGALRVVRLPSSSPANAMPNAVIVKAEQWRAILFG
jgi:double-stranded uracil-DNA glycosylase